MRPIRYGEIVVWALRPLVLQSRSQGSWVIYMKVKTVPLGLMTNSTSFLQVQLPFIPVLTHPSHTGSLACSFKTVDQYAFKT